MTLPQSPLSAPVDSDVIATDHKSQPGSGTENERELRPYNGISLSEIRLITSAQQAEQALAEMLRADVIGFDTESKPTFVKGEVSDGPHLIQLATDETAYLFQIGAEPALALLQAV